MYGVTALDIRVNNLILPDKKSLAWWTYPWHLGYLIEYGDLVKTKRSHCCCITET